MSFSTEILTGVLGRLAILAFLVSVIVEMTKELPVISKLPTKAWVLIVSVVLCVVGVMGYLAANSRSFDWYYPASAILGAFVVGYISIYGWDTFNELWDRYKK